MNTNPAHESAATNGLTLILLFLFCLGGSFIQHAASAKELGMDLDGNGLGDLWELYYDADAWSPEGDEDGDGYSNRDEFMAGTNPLDAGEFLAVRLGGAPGRSGDLSPRLPGRGGKAYALQTSSNLLDWINRQAWHGTNAPALAWPADEATAPVMQAYARLSARDIDQDQDGLSAYEEALLGFSDLDRASHGVGDRGDYDQALAFMMGGQGFALGGKYVYGRRPDLREASRFLLQATMGAPYEEIQRVANLGFSAWLDEQAALAPTWHLPRNAALGVASDEPGFPYRPFLWSWWDVNMTAPDMLRQRVAFALSEILVVSRIGSDLLHDHQWALAGYYDLLVEHALGNFRDLLYDVTYSPVMGLFLTHVKNRKADPATNRFPDENFAREIMQLFTIGLYELHQDGTRRKDAEGRDIPTYSNREIREFARVFTGLTFNPAVPPEDIPYLHDPNDPPVVDDEASFLDSPDNNLNLPMLAFEPMHDTGAKQLLVYTTLNGRVETGALPPHQTIDQDIRAAIDNLFHHPNVGPFVGRLLIQRLVKSNPGPAYIARVAAAFHDNGSGVRGDLQAVVRAILLDPEARNAGYLDDATHGMLREPYIRYLHVCRAFDVTTPSGTFRPEPGEGLDAFQQEPMAAPSVFNFFLPDHAPAGGLAEAGLVGPEFEITTATTSISAMNFWTWRLGYGDVFPSENPAIDDFESGVMDLDDEVILAGDPAALIDRLDLILCGGAMTPATRAVLAQALNDVRATQSLDDWDLTHLALYLVANTPDFAVLR